ncbi:MAG TPA: hypothetical protein VF327_10595, partial [Gaiellaceae bacterium]
MHVPRMTHGDVTRIRRKCGPWAVRRLVAAAASVLPARAAGGRGAVGLELGGDRGRRERRAGRRLNGHAAGWSPGGSLVYDSTLRPLR